MNKFPAILDSDRLRDQNQDVIIVEDAANVIVKNNSPFWYEKNKEGFGVNICIPVDKSEDKADYEAALRRAGLRTAHNDAVWLVEPIVYALICTHYNHPGKKDVFAGSLSQIINALIAHNDRWGNADLTADYWPYVYWSDPNSFLLDDEEVPENPDYTADVAIAIASTVLDESPKHIKITDTDYISHDRAVRALAKAEGISKLIAGRFIDDEIDERYWDTVKLTKAHFTDLHETLKSEIRNGNLGTEEFDDLEDACAAYKQAQKNLNEALFRRNRAIIEAARSGVRRRDIAATTGLDVSMVRRIISESL
ncbi:hypothetical protein [uncultured Corynebacterium sp.]|uniref:hypothetical protein n=1 Tax=uncultured Corynebacterium sp. TaxID=159447 RepID=UPI00288B7DD8|nr:hypothetical protein [uncultured Corynebacterium sp.]